MSSIRKTVEKQREWIENNPDKSIDEMPSEYDLSKIILDESTNTDGQTTLMDIILQPFKPVYGGNFITENENGDIENNVNRLLYIKSSSFPLIPQMTSGRKLDILRKNMEKRGIARAAYASAVKVGGMTNENLADPFEDFGDNSVLELPRKHFKLQQDKPYGKKGRVSMLTQIHKLLLGDDVMLQEGFGFDGKKINGVELEKKLYSALESMILIKVNRLLKRLKIDGIENLDDLKKSVEVGDGSFREIQNILLKEAEARDFSREDKKT